MIIENQVTAKMRSVEKIQNSAFPFISQMQENSLAICYPVFLAL
jgi:hypothetical protein